MKYQLAMSLKVDKTPACEDTIDDTIDDNVSIPPDFKGFLSDKYRPPPLPTYRTHRELEERLLITVPKPALLYVDIVKQIKQGYLKARLLIFEIWRNTSKWGWMRQTKNIRLSSPQLELDQIIAFAADEKFIKLGGGVGQRGIWSNKDEKIKKDPAFVKCLGGFDTCTVTCERADSVEIK